jgi:hypothetical protein
MIVPYLPAITISPLLNEQVESVHSVTKPYELTPRLLDTVLLTELRVNLSTHVAPCPTHDLSQQTGYNPSVVTLPNTITPYTYTIKCIHQLPWPTVLTDT